MIVRSPATLRRLLILLFAAISMFGCATGSAMSHTSDTVAAAISSDDHGHGHDGQGSIGNGVAGHHNAADHTHDTPHFPELIVASWTVPSIGWFQGVSGESVLGIAHTMDRPPRINPND